MDRSQTNEIPPAPQHDLFTDPAIERARRDDPIVKFLAQNWRPVLTTVAVGAAVWYAVQAFRTTRYEAMERSAQLFTKVVASVQDVEQRQQRLATLQAREISKDEVQAKKDKEELDKAVAELESERTKLAQRLQALGDGKAPYSGLAHIYQAAGAVREGDLAKARELLAGLKWRDVKDVRSVERFSGEYGALLLGRALLDDESGREEGRAQLGSLAQEGVYAHVAAAVTLLNSARSDDERTAATDLIESLKARAPEQGDLLGEELNG